MDILYVVSLFFLSFKTSHNFIAPKNASFMNKSFKYEILVYGNKKDFDNCNPFYTDEGLPKSEAKRIAERDAILCYAIQYQSFDKKNVTTVFNPLIEALEQIAKGTQPYNEREAYSFIETAREIANNALQKI